MGNSFQSSRDVIVRTNDLKKATRFYESVLGLPAIQHSDTLIGFETGSFCLYVEQGDKHGPVFEFLVPDIQKAKAAIVWLHSGGRKRIHSSLLHSGPLWHRVQHRPSTEWKMIFALLNSGERGRGEKECCG